MKKGVLIITALLIGITGFSQKRELRDASKAIKSNSFVDAKSTLKQIEGVIANEAPEVQAEFYLYKGQAYLGAGGNNEQDLVTAANAFKKVIEIESSGKAKLTSEAQDGMENLRIKLVNSAIADQNAENYAEASKKLYTSYTISKKDTSDLYFAAGNALNAKKYDTALEYYKILADLNYTGISKEYIITEIETDSIISFPSKEERDWLLISGKYIKPAERLSTSRRGEILRNIAFLYIDQGKNEEAKTMLFSARKENPDDVTLIRAEADIALRLNDMKTYNTLMQEVINSDPENPELYYNLGVSSATLGDREKAEQYYMQALKLDPQYTNANVNMAALILEEENTIVEEMNALGTSAKDNKRYEELKTKRESIYKKSIPYLETALQARPNNEQVMRTLMNIYTIVGEDAKSKQMKDKLAAIEN